MQGNHITVTVNERVQTITISRPEKKNALTQAMYKAMADAIHAYGKNDKLRALVITGQGEYFTAGNDLMDFSINQANSNSDFPGVLQFLFAITECEKPIIAAVNGPAIGIGLTLLLHCDLNIAGQSATFSTPFVRLAVVPEAASSQLLSRHVGMAVTNDLLLTGRTLSAKEAHQYGLLSRVVPDDQLDDEISRTAQLIASSSPTSLRKSKALIRHDRDEIRALMIKEVEIFAEQLRSDEFKESVTALMEKRPPIYN